MILERLKQYIDAKGITIAAFEREAGMSNAAFGKALKNNGAIGTDKLENILSAYPDINPVWLLTGNGNMLTSGNPAATAPDAGRSVSPTTVPAGYGNLTYRVIRVNDNRLLYEGTRDGALPDELQVETLETAAENSERSEDAPRKLPPILRLPVGVIGEGPHKCIRVRGEAMAPTLREGDFVVTAQVGRNDWPEIRERQLYLVIDTGGNPHLSRIKNRLGDYQFIACTCDNPDKGQYPDRNLMEHEIAEIWEVKCLLSANIPERHDAVSRDIEQLRQEISEIRKFLSKPADNPGERR
ncbi:helix-turn-helix transcriptional regulator [Alistipes indistinctus]|jgi:phage repressor protein C with HTH and peptisase S24 domain|uniref:helix-turn-helix transcriptional regulator n=1 Tax=Alistipes indistinctus TaxID=626932 RepID=UPI000E52E171|nr:helix-turn-helix transcriptional regulator [Alistipes indistinctus]RGU36765.1 helix-turn-helix transcriptional regulator [Alistipes indistinctus]